jgi:hypothetical protein
MTILPTQTSTRAALLVSVFTLEACTVVPGVHLPRDVTRVQGGSQNEAVELIPITQGLIVEKRSQRA